MEKDPKERETRWITKGRKEGRNEGSFLILV